LRVVNQPSVRKELIRCQLNFFFFRPSAQGFSSGPQVRVAHKKYGTREQRTGSGGTCWCLGHRGWGSESAARPKTRQTLATFRFSMKSTKATLAHSVIAGAFAGVVNGSR
jgi:hypothetical protein